VPNATIHVKPAQECAYIHETGYASLTYKPTEGHALTRTATHCNTLQHIYSFTNNQEDTQRMRYNAPQRTTTHFYALGNTLPRTATHCNTFTRSRKIRRTRIDTHYNALQHTATHCNTLQHTATPQCIALEHTAAHSLIHEPSG